MKQILLFFILVVLYSCNTDDESWRDINGSIATKSINDTNNYYFDFYSLSISKFDFDFQGNFLSGSIPYVSSYMNIDGEIFDIKPELISKPIWVDSIIINQAYISTFITFPDGVDKNISTEDRSGEIVLKQSGSNKMLSVGIVQKGSIENAINIKLTTLYANHYEFTATTTYPVKGDVTIRVPFDIYNDGGEMKDETVQIIIAKNTSTGSSIMDYNGCPLVYYHGDIKGYRLYEGKIWSTADNIYSYNFVRYW